MKRVSTGLFGWWMFFIDNQCTLMYTKRKVVFYVNVVFLKKGMGEGHEEDVI